jgi:hypothetical protein
MVESTSESAVFFWLVPVSVRRVLEREGLRGTRPDLLWGKWLRCFSDEFFTAQGVLCYAGGRYMSGPTNRTLSSTLPNRTRHQRRQRRRNHDSRRRREHSPQPLPPNRTRIHHAHRLPRIILPRGHRHNGTNQHSRRPARRHIPVHDEVDCGGWEAGMNHGKKFCVEEEGEEVEGCKEEGCC